MTQIEILNECKNEIAKKYGQDSIITCFYQRMNRETSSQSTVTDLLEEVSILFAQRMAEKFAEWTRVNAEPYIYNKEVWTVSDSDGYITHDEITTSQLYELFLTTLNKDL